MISKRNQSMGTPWGAVRYSMIAAAISAALVLAPVSRSYAAEDIATATAAGAQDAQADTSGILWFGAGCLLSWVGIILGYVIEPSPPPTRIMGKSPEYVTAYTASYKSEGKSAQGKQAIIGCLVGGAAYVAVYVVFFVVFASTVAGAARI